MENRKNDWWWITILAILLALVYTWAIIEISKAQAKIAAETIAKEVVNHELDSYFD